MQRSSATPASITRRAVKTKEARAAGAHRDPRRDSADDRAATRPAARGRCDRTSTRSRPRERPARPTTARGRAAGARRASVPRRRERIDSALRRAAATRSRTSGVSRPRTQTARGARSPARRAPWASTSSTARRRTCPVCGTTDVLDTRMAHPLAGATIDEFRRRRPRSCGVARLAAGAAQHAHRRAVRRAVLGSALRRCRVLHGPQLRRPLARDGSTTAGMRRSAVLRHRSLGARGGGTRGGATASPPGRPIDRPTWLPGVATASRAEHEHRRWSSRSRARRYGWPPAPPRFVASGSLPIVESAQAIWAQLRHQSNVALEDIELAGSGNRARRVRSTSRVDGVGARRSA